MFESLRARWNAAKQRRFEKRAAKFLRSHFGEVIGTDDETLDQPDSIKRLYEKYFRKTA
jgi:hypothetical protein